MDQNRQGYQSVLSQLVAAVFGRGVFYYVAIGSLLVVLCLSANTSFVGFPRLCRLVAADGFLPHAFTVVGRRLVYSVGIGFLTVSAGGLLIAFGGMTDPLIPLFAVGAFLAFTLSQAGMVVHWRREWRKTESPTFGLRAKFFVNGLGALATGIALAVILAAKLREGAWITILALFVLFVLFKRVKRYYLKVARKTRTRESLDLTHNEPPVVVIPTEGWNRLTDKALRFALRLSPDVISVHLKTPADGADEDKAASDLRNQWAEDVETPARDAGLPAPRLVVIRTPYRRFTVPLLNFIDELGDEHPDREIAVLVPSLVKRHWWQFLLDNYRAEILRAALMRRGDRRIVVVNIPWYLDDETKVADSRAEAVAASGSRRG
jgi:hypothetical protein